MNALDRLAHAVTAPALPTVPLLRAPDAWPPWVVGAGAMVLLAALDLVGAVAAKEWQRSGEPRALVAGVVAFLVLFWVYASALQYAELAVVTLGWIVALQVGLLVVDHVRYGVRLTSGSWVAVVVILVAQGYLLLAPSSGPADATASTGASTASGGQRPDSV